MTFGLAFEGCAGRAAFHVGVVEWLTERGARPAAVAGASSGSIVAATMAMAEPPPMRDIWLDTAGSRVFQPGRVLKGHWPFRMTDIVGEGVRGVLGDTRLRDLHRPIGISVTQLTLAGWRRLALDKSHDITAVEAVLASCYIPGPYSRMIPVGRRVTVDGAWLIRTPVDLLDTETCRRRIAVVANAHGAQIEGYFRERHSEWPDDCAVIAPEGELPVGPYDFKGERMDAAIAAGRSAAARFAREREDWLG